MGEPGWATTTHDWSRSVDHDHLRGIREHSDAGAAGGLQHAVLEVLAYADEEAEDRGVLGQAVVTRHADGSISVADDGRGTETRRDSDGRVIRKPVMATKDVRFFDDDAAPRLPDARPRRGMSTVAAVSVWLDHTNHRREGSWTQRYEHGVPASELTNLPPSLASGTTVRFLLDPSLAADDGLDVGQLAAFPHLSVELRDER